MSNLVQSIRDKGIEAFIEAEDSLPQSMDEIKAVAKQAANAICQRFENLAQMQEQMQALSREAANAESDWYHFVPFIGRNKREKQIDILVGKNALQDIHNAELLNLQQASIALSLLSTKLSSAMINEIRACVKKGFEDTDGRIKRLSQNSQRQAKLMIQSIKKESSSKWGFVVKALIIFLAVACGAYCAVKFAL